MSGDAKAFRRARQDSAGTVAQFIHPSAFAAVKVMMVRLAGYLITCCLTGQGYRVEPAFRKQRFDIAVHGRDAQRLEMMLRRNQCLFRRKRTVRFDKGVPDGLFLARVARNRLRHSG